MIIIIKNKNIINEKQKNSRSLFIKTEKENEIKTKRKTKPTGSKKQNGHSKIEI